MRFNGATLGPPWNLISAEFGGSPKLKVVKCTKKFREGDRFYIGSSFAPRFFTVAEDCLIPAPNLFPLRPIFLLSSELPRLLCSPFIILQHYPCSQQLVSLYVDANTCNVSERSAVTRRSGNSDSCTIVLADRRLVLVACTVVAVWRPTYFSCILDAFGGPFVLLDYWPCTDISKSTAYIVVRARMHRCNIS